MKKTIEIIQTIATISLLCVIACTLGSLIVGILTGEVNTDLLK